MEINATLIGQLLTFAVLVWFTMKYVWPPITKAMQEREKTIAAGLEAGERGKRELEVAHQNASNILREAKVEASQIIEQAHKRAQQILEEGKDQARVEVARMMERAKEEVHLEVSQAKEGLRKQLASLAIAGAEKIIQRNLDEAAHANLLEEFVAEI